MYVFANIWSFYHTIRNFKTVKKYLKIFAKNVKVVKIMKNHLHKNECIPDCKIIKNSH